MRLLVYLFVGIVAGFLVGVALKRWAIPVGLLLLVVGAGPMIVLYLFPPSGDPSSAGMLATLIFIMVVPFGLVLFFTGFLTSLWR